MNKPWNDSDLARLSADLDEELEDIFGQVEAALASGPEISFPDGSTAPETDLIPPIAPADILAEEELAGPDLSVADSEAFRPGAGEPAWLEPGLLGEPETAPGWGGLTAEGARELSRLIEEAVEKGVTAALRKLKP